MKKLTKKFTLLGGAILTLALLVSSFAIPAEAAPAWDASGNYVINMEYLGTDYGHDMSLTQDSSGNLTGNGGSPVGANTYTWMITSGSVSGNTIDFLADYTATADAVTPQTVLHINGTIAADGTISGTWSDNYQGGARSGAVSTVSGAAASLGSLVAEDFGVVNYDTGLGMLKGYTAGFGLTDATFAGATSVVVKLYDSSDNVLQTNTAILTKFNADITGTQFSSPFDVSGNFNYVTDGYWTNVRSSQYGQSVGAAKVIATVTLANGKVVTATNTNLTGDPTTIYPPAPSTNNHLVTVVLAGNGGGSVTSSPSGINCPGDCTESYSHNSMITLTAVAASGSSFKGWTGYACNGSATTCTFKLDENRKVTATFKLNPAPGTHPTNKDQCKEGGWMKFTNPTFSNQGDCVSYVVSHNDDHRADQQVKKEDKKDEVKKEDKKEIKVNTEVKTNSGEHKEISSQGEAKVGYGDKKE